MPAESSRARRAMQIQEPVMSNVSFYLSRVPVFGRAACYFALGATNQLRVTSQKRVAIRMDLQRLTSHRKQNTRFLSIGKANQLILLREIRSCGA